MGLIKKPPQFFAPEGVQKGEPFDIMCTAIAKGDSLMIIKVEGHTVPGYEKQAAKADKGDYSEDEPTKSSDYTKEAMNRYRSFSQQDTNPSAGPQQY